MYTYCFISKLTAQQIPQLIALYRAANWWSPATDDEALLERIVAGSHCFLTAAKSTEIVGMGRAISDGVSDAYIQDVTVKEAYRKHGIGTALVKKLVARLERDGLQWIGLIAEQNTYAFYQPLGFKVMAESVPMLRVK